MKTRLRNAIVSFLCLVLTAQGSVAIAQQLASTSIDPLPLAPLPAGSPIDGPTLPDTFAELVARAEALEPIVERLRAAIDRTQFDPTALNSSLDFDPEALARFVTEEIRFEQYRGVLRGAMGTLMGRAGNALDQSILLGHLLDEAGMDWRIARGTLSSDDAERLVNQMAEEGSGSPPKENVTELRDALTALYQAFGYTSDDLSILAQPDQEADRQYYESIVRSDTNFITDALEQAGLELGGTDAMRAFIDEATDYFWIEYRADPFDAWEIVHPAFGTIEAPRVARRDSFQTAPEDLHHRVRMEVFIEQKLSDELIVKPVLAREATTADLLGKPLSYRNFPNNFSPELAGDVQGMLRDSSVFVPTVDGVPEGNAFDLDGQAFGVGLVQLDRYKLTQVFQSQARQVEGALGALDSLGTAPGENDKSDDFFALTAQWMQYTVVAPGGEEKTYRRYLLDRVGAVNRKAGEAEIVDQAELTESAVSLLTTTVLTVMPTRVPQAYVLNRAAALIADEIALIKSAADAEEISDIPDSLISALDPPEDFLLASAFDAGHDLQQGKLSYRTAPTVVVYQQGPTERVDIVHHTRRFFDVTGGLRFDPLAAIEGGVWDSYAEQVPLRNSTTVSSTATEFRQIQEDGQSILVITPETVELVATLRHSARTKADVAEVLQNGSSVIIPASVTSDGLDSSWWRIRAETGETLGMRTGGYGGVNGEQIVLFFSVANATYNFLSCADGLSSPSGGGYACCLATGAVVFAMGAVVGAVVLANTGLPGAGLIIGYHAGPHSLRLGEFCDVR